MILQPEQIEAFDSQSRSNFEDRMVVHLQKCFPKHCKALGDDGVRDAIQHGIRRSGKYGIVSEKSVCKYTDLMFILGKNFDTDSSVPWAQEILTSDELEPDVKAHRLVQTTQEQIERLKIHAEMQGKTS